MNHSKNRMKKAVSLILGAVLVLTTFGAATFADASSQADFSQSVQVTDVNGGTLTVTAKADSGVLPDDALLSVTPITGGSIVYNDVADKVEKAASDDDKELSGFLAYDISFFVDGQSVEPSGNVNVTMDWDDSIRPSGADEDADVSVLHLKDSDAENVSSSKVVDLTDDSKAVDNTNTATVTTTGSDNAVSSADMTVDGFSIFTITWTKSSTDATRIGAVNVHYVTDKGKELDIVNSDTTTGESVSEFTSDDLAKMAHTDGGIVDLSSWAKNVTDPDNSSATYTYDHAEIGNRNGIVITGVKVQNGQETRQVQDGWNDETNTATYTPVDVRTYKLYYTTDENVTADSKWILYRDSASETGDNNANVFLIYTIGSKSETVKSVISHHVDQYGAMLHDDTTIATITDSVRNSIYKDKWDGYSNAQARGEKDGWRVANAGTWQKMYYGSFNSDTYIDSANGGGIFYRWDSATDMWHTSTTKSSDGEINGSSPEFIGDLYQVYNGKKGLTIHYVDSNGKQIKDDHGIALSNGDTFIASDNTIDGYSFAEAHLDNYKGTDFTSITYSQNGDRWSSDVKNGEDDQSISNLVNEVWLVYSREPVSKNFTVHYQYQDDKGVFQNALIYDNNASTGNSTITKAVSSADGFVKMAELDPANDSQTDSWIPSDVRDQDGNKLIYESTRIGSAEGPEVTHVSVESDGTIIYHSSFGRRMSSSNNNQWTYIETDGELKGRSFVLTRDNDGNMTLKDSQMGSPITLYYANDAGRSGDASVSASYTATVHGETTTTEYTVYSRYETTGTSTTPTHYYDIDVEESSPSTSTDVYQIMTSDNGDGSIWIDDDTKYSGLYRVGISDSLRNKLNNRGVSNIRYEWHRVTKEGNSDEKDEIVSRKQTGEHFNIAYAQADRTWLDLEAEEGSDIWAYGTKRSYYVELSYTADRTTHTFTSVPVNVNYYGELENGSFENPAVNVSKYSWNGSTNNAGNGYFANDPTSSNWSDQEVWKTTATRLDSTPVGRDIEIVNARNGSTWRNDYHWSQSDGADDGYQFAELNAESAGALYQDVITHPNETLNYWFSHRSRMESNDVSQGQTPYDSMYLVIMPTRLAMTMGKNNSELASQDELESFIDAHGGYDRDRSISEEDRITYRDDENGILIRKVSSDNLDWHKIVGTSGYTAKGGLTRFFFVAGMTASRRSVRANTVGNFLDNVGFSQELPPTSGFNITFTETFSGITMEQLAGLATNAKDVQGVTAQEHPLKLSVSNIHSVNAGSGSTQGEPNDALNGAKLAFTVEKSDSGYTITPTATAIDGTTDLFKSSDTVQNPGNYTVKTNSDGSITISWIFPDQALKRGNDEAQSERFTYSADDYAVSDRNTAYSTTDIAGYQKTRTKNAVNDGTQTNGGNNGTSVSTTIGQKTSATLNIINVYSPDSHISVRKTFSGITPSTVSELMSDSSNPYSITIKKQGTDLTKTLKGSGNDGDVSVSSVTGTNGSISYIWTISDASWGDGTYEVSESNYTTEHNVLNRITLNGKEVSVTDSNDNQKKWPDETQTVTVNNSDNGSLTFRSTSAVQSGNDVSLVNPGANINLIVGQYGSGSNTEYVVWTYTDIGIITRNAILQQINELGWTETTQATSGNTSFYSGLNNGGMAITIGNRTFQYDGRYLSLTGSDGENWNQYYATHYNVTGLSSVEDDSEIRLTNEYVPLIKIQKQDIAEDPNGVHKRLNNAVFTIYKKDDNGKKLFYQNTVSTSEDDIWKDLDDSDSNARKFTTSSNDTLGDGIVILPTNLEQGDTVYYLREEDAPQGYRSVQDIPFKIKADGTVAMLNSGGDTEISSTESGDVQMQYADSYYTFIVQDSKGIVLPLTGGKGTWMFVLIGGLMAAGASILLWYRKRSLALINKINDTRKDK